MPETNPEPARVQLDGALTVRTIASARAKLLAALADHPAVLVDCGAAESVDLTLIQLLLAARLSARQAGKPFSLAAPADRRAAGGARAGRLPSANRRRSILVRRRMSKTILSVDDSASVLQMVKLTLTGGGYDVVQATNGADGLARARGGGIDMVLTDLNMPVMNGLAMIRELRKLPQCTGVPIIFLTTESAANMKQEAKAAGATGWITKPFQQDQLLAVVRKVLGA